jgi:hypothetical protein
MGRCTVPGQERPAGRVVHCRIPGAKTCSKSPTVLVAFPENPFQRRNGAIEIDGEGSRGERSKGVGRENYKWATKRGKR